jgi:lipopolysaccharide biosynthesis regulator YciM
MRASWVEATLIFTGAVVGWYTTRRWRISGGQAAPRAPTSDYLAGLNYLVNEQPDRAVEAFLRAVAADSDTVETHFALGALFRRRGEVDRAIRIHQNLVGRTDLAPGYREQASYALAQDYLGAGLYDRAEKLLLELSHAGSYRMAALRDLTQVYELEHDWVRAIEVHRELARVANPPQPAAIAHYWCELAAAALVVGDLDTAREHLRAAHSEQRRFPRGALLRADLAVALKDTDLAIKLLRQVAAQHPTLSGEVLPRLVRALKAAGRERELAPILKDLADAGRPVADALAHAAILAGELDAPELVELARDYVVREPTVAELVAAFMPDGGAINTGVLKRLCTALRRQAQRAPRFRCSECGFSSTGFFWQCPGCKSWDGLKPLSPTELLAPSSRLTPRQAP